jgi:hypothetical protein
MNEFISKLIQHTKSDNFGNTNSSMPINEKKEPLLQ